MSTLKYTADQLITTVRLRGGLANSKQQGTTDDDILQILSECQRSRLVPGVMKVREHYFATSRRYAVSGSRLRIPARAVGQKLWDVYWLDSSSNRVVLPLVNHGDLHRVTKIGTAPAGFYLEGNHVVLVPDSQSFGGTLEVSFFLRPGDLVKAASAAVVQSVNATAKTITFTGAPPTAFTASGSYDVHSPESGAEVKQLALTGTDLSGNVLTVSEAIDGSVWGTYAVAAGDYVCLTGEAVLPGLPSEIHIALALMAVVTILSTVNPALAERKQAELQTMLSLAGYVVDSRIEQKPPKAVSHRPFSS